MVRQTFFIVGTALLVLLQPDNSIWGHDLWLVPDAQAAIGRPFTIRANSGMDFPISVQAPDPQTFARRILVGPDGKSAELSPAGQEDKSGLLRFEPARDGIYVIAVESRPKLISLAAEEFNEYLVADGLPHIYRLRAKEKSLDQNARERYSKSPKALIKLGQGGAGDFGHRLGLTLEIVPLCDPFALSVGDTFAVQVLFRGQALADANLGWDHPDDGEPPSGTVRTDTKGEAHIPIRHTGLMTIRLTHMTRPKAEDHEWESFWTTLTWRIPTEARR